MNAKVIEIPAIRVVMLRHSGPYDQIGPVFERLWGWIGAHDVPAVRTIGVYWDNPDFTPAPKLRSAACVEVPPDFQMPDRDGIPLDIAELAGGSYVTTRFVGPYEQLGPVWGSLTNYAEHALNKTISENPAFEIYVNDPSETPPAELITELFMPVL